MIPRLIFSIKRYCSSHRSGALCGFSNASWGSFLEDDLGVAREGLSIFTGVTGPPSTCSLFIRFRGDGVGGVGAPFGVVVVDDLVDRRRVVYGDPSEVLGSSTSGGVGDAGSRLTVEAGGGVPGVISVTRGFREEVVCLSELDMMLLLCNEGVRVQDR